MWENAEEFIEAIEGAYGEEEQQAAEAFAEQTGLLDQWEAEDTEAEDSEYMEALAQELARVEHQIGRQLTRAEESAMVNGISTEEYGQVVPDMVTGYAEQLSSARDTDEGRLHLAAEAAQRAMDEHEQPAAIYEPPEPAGGYEDDDHQGDYE